MTKSKKLKTKITKDKIEIKQIAFNDKKIEFANSLVSEKKISHANNTITCVVLGENKSAKIVDIPFETKSFSLDGNTYFLIPEGVFLSKNNTLVATYLEGISLPLSHKNVEKETETREYEDKNGKKHKIKIAVIKGLKFDSEILDIVLNRGLAEKFAKAKPDKVIFIVAVLVIINIIFTIGAIATKFL